MSDPHDPTEETVSREAPAKEEHSNPDTMPPLDLSFVRSTKQVANIAFLLSLAALFLAGLIFFRLQGKLSDNTGDLRKEIKTYGKVADSMKDSNAQIVSRMDALEKKLASYEDMPKLMRRQMLMEMLNELKQKTDFLGEQIEDEKLKEKVGQIHTLLQEVEENVAP